MTKTVLCLTINFLFSGRKYKPIDFSPFDRKLRNKSVRERF